MKWTSGNIVVSINSPSGEGGGNQGNNFFIKSFETFPLILLQAKAGGHKVRGTKDFYMVSINSPSGEGGGI